MKKGVTNDTGRKKILYTYVYYNIHTHIFERCSSIVLQNISSTSLCSLNSSILYAINRPFTRTIYLFVKVVFLLIVILSIYKIEIFFVFENAVIAFSQFGL